LTNGEKILKLKVKSIASTDEETLERNFIYNNASVATDSASQ
jgi:hypothetical protein